MKVITIYEAFDGEQFDDEIDCLEHELILKEKTTTLRAYGKRNKRLYDLYKDDTYNETMKIVIPDTEALKMLMELQDYCGFCFDIPAVASSIGTWKYDEKEEHWKKVG